MSDNCNNCKTRGVICNRCLHPITSVGIILFRINPATKKREYLMICRRDSIGYIEYLNGKYNQYNKDYIKTIISEMTCQERTSILNDDIIGLRSRLWGGEFKPFSLNLQSDLKHNELKNGISYNGETYSLESIISEISVVWDDKEWGFPKGRHNNQETDIMCAYREFEEEAGYSRNHINILQPNFIYLLNKFVIRTNNYPIVFFDRSPYVIQIYSFFHYTKILINYRLSKHIQQFYVF